MLKKILHIILAMTILLSAVGVTVNRHYCRQQLRAVGLWYVPASCHDAVGQNPDLPSCPLHAASAESENNNCCKNESNYFKSEVEKNLLVDNFSLTPPVANPTGGDFALHLPAVVFSATDYRFFCFHPPPDRAVRRVLYQCFLL